MVWRLEAENRFPIRVRLIDADHATGGMYGGGTMGWFEDEIDAWIESRARVRTPLKPSGRRVRVHLDEGAAQ